MKITKNPHVYYVVIKGGEKYTTVMIVESGCVRTPVKIGGI